MASPEITAWQSQPASMRSRPSTNTSRGLHRQRRHRARQRPQRGAQDVVAVDARRRREGHRHLGAGADLCVELLALLAVELLGIVEPARNAVGIEDHGGGDHRTGQRPPARLVAARDRPDAALQRRALAAEGRADGLLAQRQAGDLMAVAATHAAMVRGTAAKSMRAWRRVKCGEELGQSYSEISRAGSGGLLSRQGEREPNAPEAPPELGNLNRPAHPAIGLHVDTGRAPPPRDARPDRRNSRYSRPRTVSCGALSGCRTGGQRMRHRCVDLAGDAAVPGQRHAAKRLRPGDRRRAWHPSASLSQGPERQHDAAGIEERNLLAGRLRAARKPSAS